MRSAATALIIVSLSAISSRADTIYLVDGSSIADCRIQREGLLLVEYRADGKKAEVASDKVLQIEFDRKPTTVDRADVSAADELYLDAVADLQEYIAGVEGKPQKTYPWAPAYSIYRLLEINATLGNGDGVVAAADQLIAAQPDSRYLPHAFLKKAQAQNAMGAGDKAIATLDAFGSVISDKGLSERWKLEHELAKTMYDSALTGQALRDKLESVSRQAKDQPVVKSRADVAIAESFLAEDKLDKAEALFEAITSDPKADTGTLAAAYTGLGDCLYRNGSNKTGEEAEAELAKALRAYMRVVVLYKGEVAYVPKALFYAARICQQAGDDDGTARARKLYSRLIRNFEGSRWATEARGGGR